MNIKTLAASLIAFLNPPQPVASILADMEKNVTRLTDAAQRRIDLAVQSDDRAAKHAGKAEAHRIEAERALRVAERFDALLS